MAVNDYVLRGSTVPQTNPRLPTGYYTYGPADWSKVAVIRGFDDSRWNVSRAFKTSITIEGTLMEAVAAAQQLLED